MCIVNLMCPPSNPLVSVCPFSIIHLVIPFKRVSSYCFHFAHLALPGCVYHVTFRHVVTLSHFPLKPLSTVRLLILTIIGRFQFALRISWLYFSCHVLPLNQPLSSPLTPYINELQPYIGKIVGRFQSVLCSSWCCF